MKTPIGKALEKFAKAGEPSYSVLFIDEDGAECLWEETGLMLTWAEEQLIKAQELHQDCWIQQDSF